MTNATSKGGKRLKLARNSLYGVLSWLLPIFPSLIVTPIVVRRLGNEKYGLYAAILGITSYFFTLGVGKIATKYVAEYRAAGEDARASALLSATLIITAAPTLLCGLVLMIAAPWLVRDVLRIDPALTVTAETGIWLAAGIILLTALAQAWQSALQGL